MSMPRLFCHTGFTKRDESDYDPFGAGHSSTSVSAALGMAVGRDMKARGDVGNGGSCVGGGCRLCAGGSAHSLLV